MRGDELTLNALKREHKRLTAVAERAKRELDEYMGVGNEMISLHNELVEIIQSKQTGKDVINKLENLQKRRDKTRKILEKDLITLSDKQFKAESERGEIAQQIFLLEMRLSKVI